MGSITNLKENRTIFIPCDCKSEILVIEFDHEIGEANLAIYENSIGHKHKLSLWQRLRYCYQILINKKPYADQIVLSKNQLKDLQKFLKELDL